MKLPAIIGWRRVDPRAATRLVLVVTALMLAGDGLAQDAPRFREPVSVKTDSQVVKTLETAREHLQEQQWAEAVSILQQLIDTSGTTLVPVETGRYWNTARYCHLLISRMPPAGLAVYRQRVDAQARDWFEAGRDTLDEEALQRVVRFAFNSTYGDDALLLLGEVAFERGRFAMARQSWQRLLPAYAPAADLPPEARGPARTDAAPLVQPPSPASDLQNAPQVDQPDLTVGEPRESTHLTYPDSTLDQAAILARLVLCGVFEGDIPRARHEYAAFKKFYPEADGELGGRSGRYAELLDEMLEAAVRRSTAATSGTATPSGTSSGAGRLQSASSFHPADGVQTLGGQLSRNPQPESEPHPDRLTWSRALPVNRFRAPTGRQRNDVDSLLAYFPVVADGTVFYCGSDSIFAVELATGRPRWPIDAADNGELFTNTLDNRPLRPHLPMAGIAAYTATVSEGRLYARMGPPLARRSRNEGNAYSEIVGLDISGRQGDLVFRVTSDVFDEAASSPEATQWSFDGSPIAEHGRVYVSARRGSPEDEVQVACFDAETGGLIWKQHVCSSLRNSPDHYNLLGHNLLTMADGRLFLATGLGAVAALDAATGQVEWVVTYKPRDEEAPHSLSDPQRHGLAPPVHDRGIVYVAPTDSDLLLALDATTGHLVWQRRWHEPVLHLPGVADGRLIVSGRSLEAVDAMTGDSVWPMVRIHFEDPQGSGYGRPALTGSDIYWPRRDGILKVDIETGLIRRLIPLREAFGRTGGNLLIADGRLLIAAPDELIVLGDDPVDESAPVELPRRVGLQIPADDGRQSAGRETDDSAEPRWPVKRVARMALPSDAIVLRVRPMATEAGAIRPRKPDSRGTGPATAAGPIELLVQQADQVIALDGAGQSRWTAVVAASLNWAGSSRHDLVVASEVALQGIDCGTGRLCWQQGLIADDSRRFDVIGNRVLIVDRSGLRSVEPFDGTVTRHVPPRGQHWTISNSASYRQSATWIRSASHALFQPAGQPQCVLFDLSTGREQARGAVPSLHQRRLASVSMPVAEFPAATTSARGPGPRQLPPRPGVIGVNESAGIELAYIGDSPQGWSHATHRVALNQLHILSRGQTSARSDEPPSLLPTADPSQNGVVVVVENGLFATRLDPADGHSLWRAAIGPLPLDSPTDQSLITDRHFVAVSDSMVRAFDLNDGHLAWSEYLGPGTWQIHPVHGAVMCLPLPGSVVSQPVTDTATIWQHHVMANIHDTATGRLIQRLNIGPRLISRVTPLTSAIAVSTSHSLTLFRPM